MIEIIDKIHDEIHSRVKDKEKAKIFKYVCQNPGITRKSVIKDLNMRPNTVTTFVTELIDQKLVYEGSLQNDGKKGRPEVELYTDYDRFVVISLYVVSKQVKGVLFNLKEEVLAENSVRVPWDVDNENLMNILVGIVNTLSNMYPSTSVLLGCGISFLGNVNQVTKELLFSTRWQNIRKFSFDELGKRLDLEVVVYTSLEAQMEYLLMQEPEYQKDGTLLYHWGYGVGASFSNSGQVLRSGIGCIMEVGHIVYDPNSEKRCICGLIGCIETECAIWSISEQLPFPAAQVPEDETEFQNFFIENDLITLDVINQAAKVAAYGLNILYNILFPRTIIIESPFLADEKLYSYFLEVFYKNIPQYTHDDLKIITLESGFRGEIYGCTYSLFKTRLRKELKAL